MSSCFGRMEGGESGGGTWSKWGVLPRWVRGGFMRILLYKFRWSPQYYLTRLARQERNYQIVGYIYQYVCARTGA